MANMHGQFAIVMAMSGTQEAVDRITADIDALRERTGMDVRLTPVSPAARRGDAAIAVPAHRPGSRPGRAGARGRERPLRSLARVNIESMQTTLEPAPVTGAPLFAMVTSSPGVPEGHPRPGAPWTELARVCDSLGIELAPRAAPRRESGTPRALHPARARAGAGPSSSRGARSDQARYAAVLIGVYGLILLLCLVQLEELQGGPSWARTAVAPGWVLRSPPLPLPSWAPRTPAHSPRPVRARAARGRARR